MHLLPSVAIQPNLEMKTQPKQLLGSLPLVIALPVSPHTKMVISELVKFFSLTNPVEPCSDHFNDRLPRPRGINKDPTVWLDGTKLPL
jgi:hypothetical protein